MGGKGGRTQTRSHRERRVSGGSRWDCYYSRSGKLATRESTSDVISRDPSACGVFAVELESRIPRMAAVRAARTAIRCPARLPRKQMCFITVTQALPLRSFNRPNPPYGWCVLRPPCRRDYDRKRICTFLANSFLGVTTMRVRCRSLTCLFFSCVCLLWVIGCGRSSEPTATSSDELGDFLSENPDVASEDAPEIDPE